MHRNLLTILSTAVVLPLALGCGHPPAQNPGQDSYKSQVQWKPYNGKKMRIAIADFSNRSGYGGTQFARTGQKMLSSALTQSGHFDVFEGDAVSSVLNQQGFQNSGVVTAESAVKIGGMIGAQYLVEGTITELGESRDKTELGINFQQEVVTYKATIDVSVIDLQTGQTVVSDTETATIADKSTRIAGFGKSHSSDDSKVTAAIRDGIDKVAVALVDKTPTSGNDFQIASVDGAKIAINAGTGDITSGQQLKVIHRGKEITDPSTGAHLGWDEREIGLIEVVDVQSRLSYCRVVKGTSFSVGDVVRP